MTIVISIIVAVGLVGFIIGGLIYNAAKGNKFLNTKEDVERYERDDYNCWEDFT